MIFFHQYIEQFRDSDEPEMIELAEILQGTRGQFDIFSGGDPSAAFEEFVDRYNWLGDRSVKDQYGITQNLARNLPGAMMQDFLLNLAVTLCKPYPILETFTEVRVPFGHYPLWEGGEVHLRSPAERSDLAVGYLTVDGTTVQNQGSWPKQPYYRLEPNQSVIPLITVNSKIRISQSEFFDWHGREQLMTKGNPHCLSVQVALRKEMVMSIVEAAQAEDKFFLLGEGGETNVVPNREELDRFIETFSEHLEKRMED